MAVPVKFNNPVVGADGGILVQLIISNWKSCITLPTKLPLESYSWIKTTTTKFPWIVGVKVISPVFGLILMPLIGLAPEYPPWYGTGRPGSSKALTKE